MPAAHMARGSPSVVDAQVFPLPYELPAAGIAAEGSRPSYQRRRLAVRRRRSGLAIAAIRALNTLASARAAQPLYPTEVRKVARLRDPRQAAIHHRVIRRVVAAGEPPPDVGFRDAFEELLKTPDFL